MLSSWNKGFADWFMLPSQQWLMAGVCNLFSVLAITCPLFTNETLASSSSADVRVIRLKVLPMDSTLLDASTCMWNTSVIVYSGVRIQTQLRHLTGDCAHLEGLLMLYMRYILNGKIQGSRVLREIFVASFPFEQLYQFTGSLNLEWRGMA